MYGAYELAKYAFTYDARKEIYRRDNGVCQCADCIGIYIEGYPRSWANGWNGQAAHYPELHKPYDDPDTRNGRYQCTFDHIVEEINRGNDSGAELLYVGHTIRNYNWMHQTGLQDPKPPMSFFYDWAEGDSNTRKELAHEYATKYQSYKQMSLI